MCPTLSMVCQISRVYREKARLRVSWRSQLRLVHPVRLNSRVLGFLCTHLVMSGIQKCTFRAWMKRHASESWQWRNFSTVLVLGPRLESRKYTDGW